MNLQPISELLKNVYVFHSISDINMSNRDYDCLNDTYTIGFIDNKYLFECVYRAWNNGNYPSIYSGIVSKSYASEGSSRGKNILYLDDKDVSDIKLDLFSSIAKYFDIDEYYSLIKEKSLTSLYFYEAFVAEFGIEIKEIEFSKTPTIYLRSHEIKFLNCQLKPRLSKETMKFGDPVDEFDLIVAESSPAKKLNLKYELSCNNVLGLQLYAYSKFQDSIHKNFLKKQNEGS